MCAVFSSDTENLKRLIKILKDINV
jgi:hypothetical protein